MKNVVPVSVAIIEMDTDTSSTTNLITVLAPQKSGTEPGVN